MVHPSLKHTLKHISAVGIILLLALMLGKLGSGVQFEGERVNSLLGSTGDSNFLYPTTTTGTNTTTSSGTTYTNTTTSSGTTNTSTTTTTSTNTTGTTSTVPGTNTTIALMNVSYGVIPVDTAAYCENGIRRTPVGFFTLPTGVGYFRVRYPNGAIMMIPPGQLPLTNGRYFWEGIPAQGYQSVTPGSGEFELSGTCSTASTENPYQATGTDSTNLGLVSPTPVTSGTTMPTQNSTPPASSGATNTTTIVATTTPFSTQTVLNSEGQVSTLATTTKAIPTLTETIMTRVLRDNVMLINNAVVGGEIELRVVANDADAASFVVLYPDGTKRSLGDAELDKFLSRSGEEVWVYYWDTRTSPNNQYRVFAVLSAGSGMKKQSLPISLVVKNASLTQQVAMSAPPQVNEATSAPVSITPEENILAKVISPESCSTPTECRMFCESSITRNSLCREFVKQVAIPVASTTLDTPKDLFTARIGARNFIDSDGDGISTYDEINLYQTDPFTPDTDNDGVPDGNELLLRTNPAGQDGENTATSSSESVRFEDPKQFGELRPELLAINQVVVASTSTTPEGSVKADKISFQGRGLPNSFVTLYIFSDPIVVTVKTDAEGVWVYTLDKELSDGSHQIFTAITDPRGKILAKSEPLPFVKQAAAISVGEEALLPRTPEKVGFFSRESLIALAALLVGILGVAFSIIGFAVHHRREIEHSHSM